VRGETGERSRVRQVCRDVRQVIVLR